MEALDLHVLTNEVDNLKSMQTKKENNLYFITMYLYVFQHNKLKPLNPK